MKKLTLWFLAGVGLAFCGANAGCYPAPPPPAGPSLDEADYHAPGPKCVPHPAPRRHPFHANPVGDPLVRLALFEGRNGLGGRGSFFRGGPAHNGKEVAVHLPASQHLRNKRGRDGAGLCVYSAVDDGADYQNVTPCVGLRDYMTQFDGGGYPEKLAKYIGLMAAANHMPTPGFVQVTNGDVAALELMLKTGRYACTTYGGNDGVFYDEEIAHMVNTVYLDAEDAAIQDNNYPGEYLWMSRRDYLDRWGGRVNGGWAFCWLNPPPPPIPFNDRTPPRRTAGADADLLTVADRPKTGQAYNPKALLGYWQEAAHLPGVVLYWERFRKPDGGLRDECRGGYYVEKGVYRAWDGGSDKWGEWGEPPAAVPPQFTAGRTKNFGVVTEKINEAPAYSVGDVAVSRAQLTQAVTGTEDGRLSDDSKALRVTVTSKDAAWRHRVLDDLHRGKISERVLIQDYPEGHWAVRTVGIREGVLVQEGIGRDGRGRVLLDISRAEYTGAEQVLSAIRRVADGYDPNANPHLGDPPVPLAGLVAGGVVLLLAAGLVAVLAAAWAVKAVIARRASQ